jgi:hypothetical protein
MYNLFIDESGKSNLKGVDAYRPHFSLAGIIVHDSSKQVLKTRADQIKFKYWGKTNIVFHAQELRCLTGDFKIFKQENAKFTIEDFYSDFKTFLNGNYKIGFACVNKQNYIQANPEVDHALRELVTAKPESNWKKMIIGREKRLLKDITTEILTMYLSYLKKKKANGTVVVESSAEAQDIDIFSSYNKVLISGFSPFNMSTEDVRNLLTGVSFVTKRNHDIEAQLADIAAHYFNIEARLLDSVQEKYQNPNDESVIKILKSKTFPYQSSDTGFCKNSFCKLH